MKAGSKISVGEQACNTHTHTHAQYMTRILQLCDCVFCPNLSPAVKKPSWRTTLGPWRDKAFHNVEVLIYVFDVESRDIVSDMHYYQSYLGGLSAQLSQGQCQRDMVLGKVGGRGCGMGEGCL